MSKEVTVYSQQAPEHACGEEKLPEGKVVASRQRNMDTA